MRNTIHFAILQSEDIQDFSLDKFQHFKVKEDLKKWHSLDVLRKLRSL